MRILREDTGALLIDIQEKLLPAMDKAEETLGNITRLITGLNILEVPMLPVRHYPKGIGDIVPEVREALGEYTPGEKITFSAMDTPDIAQRVQSMGKKNILVFGLEAHICVLQTVIDLLALGYNVVMITDCVGSRKSSDYEMGLRRAEEEGAFLASSESILFELLRKAGTDTFKQISKLVK